jgi:ATP-dependent Clp protease adapter protein ClpS
MSEPRRSDGASPPDGATQTGTQTRNKPQSRQLPPYKVLLHNDSVNEAGYVVRTIIELTHLGKLEAQRRMLEAHHLGISLLLVTHKERAELFVEQFTSKGLTVTSEPA